jgi:hypothetical protein
VLLAVLLGLVVAFDFSALMIPAGFFVFARYAGHSFTRPQIKKLMYVFRNFQKLTLSIGILCIFTERCFFILSAYTRILIILKLILMKSYQNLGYDRNLGFQVTMDTDTALLNQLDESRFLGQPLFTFF